MIVVVVESPAKAKTINKYLGKDYEVLASYGHIRDLPAKDGSVRPEDDFAMSWEMDAKSSKRLNDIATALKGADKLVLATDPDREGEAISWHVLEVLRRKGALKDKEIERVVFNAITKAAVTNAIAHPRQIDDALVEAYLARRALDYLVGFNLSPVLWRKLPGARSAGRVQSVALRLICERELEIEAFIREEYWTIEAVMSTGNGEQFAARLQSIAGTRLGKMDIADEASAKAIQAAMTGGRYTVRNVDTRPAKRHPAPPFTTSTLQQEASRKLGFSSQRTMQVAQKLYEGVSIDGDVTGLITYMRTDGVQMADEAIAQCRNVIQGNYGEPYLPSAPRIYKTKAKNAQEAHEAIRPTELSRLPNDVKRTLDADQMALYDLIWKRTMASQMESADFERTSADISTEGNDGKTYTLRANGSVLKFDGFLKVYEEGKDEPEDEEDKRLPKLANGDVVGATRIEPVQHSTEPPPRYSEASLIKRMEELGIGRPSTYTAILTVLKDRGYVKMDQRRLVPEDKGRLVTAFLESFFKRYVQYDFTADLEEQLDKVSAGDKNWKQLLADFWKDFSSQIDETKELRVSNVLDALNDLLENHVFPEREDGTPRRSCPSCEAGQLSLKLGKFGAFVGCSNYPECRYTRQLGTSGEGDAQAVPAEGIVLGEDPETGQPVTRHDGRFGPYVQLGKAEDGEKPPRASIPKSVRPEELELELALKLLSLPREVGIHPDTGKPITAGLGRYGPFVLHDGTYANLPDFEEIFTVGLNRSVDLIAEKQASRGGRRQQSALKDLGPYPDGDGNVLVMEGRYGPYVKYGKVNATLPKDVKPEDLTMEQAVELIVAKGGGKAGKAPARKAAKKKAAKKAPARKPAKKAANKATG
jgi:DNA topoisomerase I